MTASAGGRAGLWSGLAVVTMCIVLATTSRLAELARWHDDPAQYFAAGVPIMTTLDAYYSLRLARLHASGRFVPHGPVPARHYSRPELTDANVLYEQREPKRLPLLSGVVGELSRMLGVTVDAVGLVLAPLLSGLFMLPLFMSCWRLGAPAAGVMGGLVGAFCIDYFRRTSVGWVDTDALNLFFPWTATWLILSVRGDQRRETQLLLAGAAGLVMYVFFLWYEKPGLTLAYGVAFAVHMLIVKAPWRRTLLCVATFAVFANVAQFAFALVNVADFAARYLLPSAAPTLDGPATVRFADVWSTIGEVRRLPVADVLARTAGRADVGLVGLVGFALFALSRRRLIAALAPIALLGAMAFVSERFVFYLAPLVGIGWGYLLNEVVAWLIAAVSKARSASDEAIRPRGRDHVPRWLRVVASRQGESRAALGYAAALVVFALLFVPLSPSTTFVPRPAIPAPVVRDLQVLAQRLPADARLWTWWDYGFAIVDVTGFGVYHDGAAQYTPQTNLVAASFVAADPRAMQDIIRFVDREGNQGIRRLAAASRDFNELVARVPAPDRAADQTPIYVLFTPDMMLKYPAMRRLGTPPSPSGPRPDLPGIRSVPCEEAVDDALHCAGRRIDLRTGSIEAATATEAPAQRIRLRRAVVIEGGRVLREREFDAGADLTVEVVRRNATVIAVYLLDETAYASNLNQMFMLGRFDAARFDESFNDFPYVRVFRVRP